MRYLVTFIFCVTVYFNDGTIKIFEKANYVSEDSWGHTQKITEVVYNKNGSVEKYNYLAQVSTESIKYIDLNCLEKN